MHPSAHAKTHPDKPAYIMAYSGETVTYAELEARSTIQLAWIDPAAHRARGEAVYPLVLERLVEAVLDAVAPGSE